MKYYAGIGSRKVKDIAHIRDMMIDLGMKLAQRGYILRSGGAQGADQAFELGCDRARGQKEIYLPWPGFEGSDSQLFNVTPEALAMAERFHPAWHRLSQGGRKLQARNCYQIFGRDLQTPVDFVLCWTPGGRGEGGTGQAIRIARHYNIKVHDLGISSVYEMTEKWLKGDL